MRLKLSLFLNYVVFAILLNSVGTVILQVQNNYGVSATGASILEAFKDLSIALVSFVVASFITRIGYKQAMLTALGLVTVACLLMPQVPAFWTTKLLFAAVGSSFALIKVSAFATIGLVTRDADEHASFMNFLESIFMIGVLSGYFLFSAFVDSSQPQSTNWLRVYYVLAAMAGAAFLLLLTTPLDESQVRSGEKAVGLNNMADMLRLAVTPVVLVFVLTAFTYVLMEQGIMSWLPTFNNKYLKLPASLSIQMASILAASTALGRFLAGFILQKVSWYWLLMSCLVIAGGLVLLALPLAEQAASQAVMNNDYGWGDAPAAAFIFPLIGLFIAPIYPAINSAILSSLPLRQHGPMAGLIVVFSALGGTTGSLITGRVFELYGGQAAFYASLVPITLLLVLLTLFRRMQASMAQPAA
ncbi:major facilitator transporter [Fibrella aestuarina BUZ 2]|uniref:Major facilitator transporter n=1 Tax=Fibrella aestuarina BUZ 2 TaxID=1166018 RepID=I0K362_9BACT|nr:MFS transporter [Fibrella aestuarina]CCG98565.1 major facilitator transporter [Fibrella aestuarina BUZ 2]